MAEIHIGSHDTHAQDKQFERRVALVTAIIAVLMAFSALGANYSTKTTLLAQQEASDQWAYYQGKGLAPDVRKTLEDMQAKFEGEAARYAKEKKEIEPEARRHEARRDLAGARSLNYHYAEVLFQISIVLGSVAILSESRNSLIVCLVLAAAAGLLAANGLLLLVPLPH